VIVQSPFMLSLLYSLASLHFCHSASAIEHRLSSS